MKLRAFYGDVHGCAEELKQLHQLVSLRYPGIEHWHVGDLIDRGPLSGPTVKYVRKYFQGGVVGNHELAMVKLWKRLQSQGLYPNNPDKNQVIRQLDQSDIDYFESLPFLHVFDDVGLVIVHGGLFHKHPLYLQAHNQGVTNNQMIHMNPDITMQVTRRWWGTDAHNQPKMNKTEAESYGDGYRRWYQLYDHDYDCIYGHSVIGLTPHVSQRENFGKTIGIDTGSCFGGYLTAYIYPLMEYVQVECPEYVIGKNVREFKNETTNVCGD